MKLKKYFKELFQFIVNDRYTIDDDDYITLSVIVACQLADEIYLKGFEKEIKEGILERDNKISFLNTVNYKDFIDVNGGTIAIKTDEGPEPDDGNEWKNSHVVVYIENINDMLEAMRKRQMKVSTLQVQAQVRAR